MNAKVTGPLRGTSPSTSGELFSWIFPISTRPEALQTSENPSRVFEEGEMRTMFAQGESSTRKRKMRRKMKWKEFRNILERWNFRFVLTTTKNFVIVRREIPRVTQIQLARGRKRGKRGGKWQALCVFVTRRRIPSAPIHPSFFAFSFRTSHSTKGFSRTTLFIGIEISAHFLKLFSSHVSFAASRALLASSSL